MDGPLEGGAPDVAAPGALAPGVRIGRYELVLLVREDAWLARERTTARAERLVGLTFAPASLAGDARFRELLRQEVRLAVAVAHPNVAQLLELGEEGEHLFVVSEWVEGETLAELRAATAAKKGIPAPILLRILADACGGLHAAHLLRDSGGRLLNVVHADVSPGSLILGPGGVARVVDLGFAKARARHNGGANVSWLESEDGAPKPPPGQRIDRHADVWGIGAILAQSLAHVAGSTATPDGTGPTVPSLVSELVLRARSTDPAERFATAAEMQGAIEAAMVTLGMPTTRASVAAFVKEHLGDRSAARASAILRARVKLAPVISIPTPAAESVRATAHTAPPFPVSARSPRAGNPALFAAGFLVAVLGSGALGYVTMHARDHAHGAAAAAPAPVPVLPASPPPRPSCPSGMAQVLGGSSCLDLAPVTTEAYKACSDAGDCKRAATENRWPGITAADRATYDPLCRERDPKLHAHEPMNCVDRDMAAVYCAAHGSRLPTEGESALGAAADAAFSEWGRRPNDVPTNRSYAVGFRCARPL